MRPHAPLAALLLAVFGGPACGGDKADEGAVFVDAGPDASDEPDASDLQEVAQQFRLPEALPEAPGNQYGDREDAAMFGFHLFFDKGLSVAATCPSCHLPELAFTDRAPVSIGKAVGTRNAPTTFNAARLSVFLWDGSADSLWSQALLALENPVEMDSTRLDLAHRIADHPPFRAEYEGVFGALPDTSAWPPSGKPGQAAFDDLPLETQFEVNSIAANVGKAIEAYERKNSTGLAPLDRYLDGDTSQLSSVAVRGLQLFLAQGCVECHKGPMFTDEDFHDVGFPSLEGAAPDSGRAGGIAVLEANPFNLAGPYADPRSAVNVRPGDAAKTGAFRTPSLRNVARTAPYGHDGALPTLREVLAVHGPTLDEQDTGAVIAFLTSLNGDYPLSPWSKWPSPQ